MSIKLKPQLTSLQLKGQNAYIYFPSFILKIPNIFGRHRNTNVYFLNLRSLYIKAVLLLVRKESSDDHPFK